MNDQNQRVYMGNDDAGNPIYGEYVGSDAVGNPIFGVFQGYDAVSYTHLTLPTT